MWATINDSHFSQSTSECAPIVHPPSLPQAEHSHEGTHNNHACYCARPDCRIDPPSLDRSYDITRRKTEAFFDALGHINDSSYRDQLVYSTLLVHGDSLDYDLVSILNQQVLFSKKVESHRALHALIILQGHENVSKQDKTLIQKFFEMITEDLKIRWTLFRDSNNASVLAKSCQFQYQESFPDTASESIRNCPSCFLWLLSSRVIHPEYFNSAGLSFFFLAIQSNRFEIAHKLISKMKPEEFLRPAAFMAERPLETVLQMCVMYRDLFVLCLDRMEGASSGHVDLRDALDDMQCAYICRFADAGLATRMRCHNIDLSDTAQALPQTIWTEIILYHPNPVSLFDWLWQSCCCPYEDTTLLAAQHDHVDAAHWLLLHTFDPKMHFACALEMASRQTQHSLSIMVYAIQRFFQSQSAYPIDWRQQMYDAVLSTCTGQEHDDMQNEKLQAIYHVACSLGTYGWLSPDLS